MKVLTTDDKTTRQLFLGFNPDLLRPVNCVSIKEVFTPKEVEKILCHKDFKCNQCHSNTGLFCVYVLALKDYVVSFCEGVVDGLIKHCWNKVVRLSDGKEYYVDITTEVANGEGVNDKRYELYAEWTSEEIVKLFNKYKKAFIPYSGTDIGKKHVKVDKIAGTVIEELYKDGRTITRTHKL